MHAMVATSVAAASQAGINRRGRPYAFELLGYDFMVDDDLRVYLIEVWPLMTKRCYLQRYRYSKETISL